MKPDPLQQLREVHAVQGRDGCWDIDDYMLGLYNGLELALSLMEQRDVHYKQRKAIATEESSATQEPVGFYDASGNDICTEIPMGESGDWWQPVYLHPQPKVEQEPVAWKEIHKAWADFMDGHRDEFPDRLAIFHAGWREAEKRINQTPKLTQEYVQHWSDCTVQIGRAHV